MTTLTSSLTAAGLTDQQATLYELLLARGRDRASRLVREVPWKRGVVYKILSELVEIGLVEEIKTPGAVTTFAPKHPLSLKDLAERREREARDRTLSLESALPSLVSQFNLSIGTPGVLVYEGKEGVERLMDDSLTAKEVIYSYVDVEAVEKNIGDLNAHYMKKRERLEIYKKLLVFDNPFTRDLYSKEKSLVTDVRIIPSGEHPHEVSMLIYDGKVSYLTLLPDKMLGVLIEDQRIYQMHRHLFEILYEKAEKLA